MSFIGLDLGTSSVKVGVFTDGGEPLVVVRRRVRPDRPMDGAWEVDVGRVRRAAFTALRQAAASAAVRNDPPVAISFSASGREVFPVGARGEVLGPCLMTADARGDEDAADVAALLPPADWFRLTGHVPARMDPVSRMRWWIRARPEVAERARWFLNWHEYFALVLAGRPVVDQSGAGAWAIFDLDTRSWSVERAAELRVGSFQLADVLPSGTVIGPLLPEVADHLGLPRGVLVVTGAWDAFAAAVGSGAVHAGQVALSCGTWSTFVTPLDRPGALSANDGVAVHPYPVAGTLGLFSGDPNGMSVVDWLSTVSNANLAGLDAAMALTPPEGPGRVRATVSFTPNVAGKPTTGATLHGLTLATTPYDLLRGLLEAVACAVADRLAALDVSEHEMYREIAAKSAEAISVSRA